jgi:hypothetical protein
MDWLPIAMRGVLTNPEIYADWLKEYQRIEDEKWREIGRGLVIAIAVPFTLLFGAWFVMEVLVPLLRATFA